MPQQAEDLRSAAFLRYATERAFATLRAPLGETGDAVVAVSAPPSLAGCSPGDRPSPSTSSKSAMSGTESTSRTFAFQDIKLADMLKS